MNRPALAVLLLLSCANGASAPEEPALGKVSCGHCSMLVSERAPAAQAVLADNARRYFDDVGCMVSFIAQEKAAPKAMWVVSPDGTWVDAQRTRFNGGQRTPMDFGYLPATNGALSFAEVRSALAKPREAAP